jgi:hypothetical protein
VLERILNVAWLSALACAACSAQSDGSSSHGFEAQDAAAQDAVPGETDIEAASGTSAINPELGARSRGDKALARSAGEAVCPANHVEKPAPEPGSALWLESYGAPEITSVASDAANNVLVSRGGSETAKLSATGALIWSKPFGSLVATDDAGNVYVAGTLETPLSVDGTLLQPRGGGRDAFVAKLDPLGKMLYGTTLGGSEDDDVQSLAVDRVGHVVVSGAGLGTVKLEPEGNVAWTRSFFGHVALDSTASVVLTGSLAATQDFGAGPLSSRGGSDVFVVKLAAGGQHVFSRSFGDAGELQQGQAIAVDGADNLTIAGVFDGSLDFGAGPALALAPGSCPAEAWCKTSGFVAKLDAAGHTLWSKSRGPMRELSGIATDSRDNVVVSGALPGGVTPFRQSYLSKLDGAGNELWHAAEWPGTGIGSGHRVAVGPCDDLIWSVSVRPTRDADENAYLARLAP